MASMHKVDFTNLFPLGELVITPGAIKTLGLGLNPADFLRRHAAGDWGDLDGHDKQVNADALRGDGKGNFGRLMSEYTLPGGQKLWVITEADRSVTTILLPEEY